MKTVDHENGLLKVESKTAPRRLRIGGVMRCCEETLRRHQATGEPEEPGQVLPCLYCRSSLIVGVQGAWEWNRGEIG